MSYHPPSYKQLHSEPSAKHLKSKDWTGLAFLTVSCGLFTYFVLLGRSVWGKFNQAMLHCSALTQFLSLEISTTNNTHYHVRTFFCERSDIRYVPFLHVRPGRDLTNRTELVYGHEHRAFPRYVLRDWKVLSQILIAAGSSVMLWFNPLAFTLLEQLMRSGSTMEKAWEIVGIRQFRL